MLYAKDIVNQLFFNFKSMQKSIRYSFLPFKGTFLWGESTYTWNYLKLDGVDFGSWVNSSSERAGAVHHRKKKRAKVNFEIGFHEEDLDLRRRRKKPCQTILYQQLCMITLSSPEFRN